MIDVTHEQVPLYLRPTRRENEQVVNFLLGWQFGVSAGVKRKKGVSMCQEKRQWADIYFLGGGKRKAKDQRPKTKYSSRL